MLAHDCAYTLEYNRGDRPRTIRTGTGRSQVRSDLPYAALWGEDPAPPRPHIFHASGLPPGARVGDVIGFFGAAGLGKVGVCGVEGGGPACACARAAGRGAAWVAACVGSGVLGAACVGGGRVWAACRRARGRAT